MTTARFDELRANAESQTDLLSPTDVVECLDEIARLSALVYVPGSFQCPKCKFSLTKAVLYVKSGTIGVGHHCDEKCPNDGTAMEPVTWEADARQMAELMPELAHLRKLRDVGEKMARLTMPQPIDELHEDDCEVLLVRWGEGDSLDEWECGNLLDVGFDKSRWTHFYPLPLIQPPKGVANV